MAKPNLKALLEKKLSENSQRHADAVQEADFDVGRQHTRLHINLIDPNPYQPRTAFPSEELEKLALSIKESGLLQPVTVRQYGDRYQLIAGERRLRAHKLLGKLSIETIIVPSTDAEMATLALAENIDRADLSDFEIGKALRQIENLFPNKTRLAESVGINREDMYRYFAYESFPENIIQRLSLNPRLLSRSAASEIKRILKDVEQDLAAAAFNKVWALLEQGDIEQSKIGEWLQKELQAKKDGIEVAPDKARLLDVTFAGKKVGFFSRNSRQIVLKLNAVVLDENQERRLQDFVQSLINEKV